MWATILNWLISAIGVYLIYTGVRAVLYFQNQERIMGSNWVLHSFLQTSVTITVVAFVLFAVRIVVLIFAQPLQVSDPFRIYGGVISGLAILWLLLKPDRLRRLFTQHEGR